LTHPARAWESSHLAQDGTRSLGESPGPPGRGDLRRRGLLLALTALLITDGGGAESPSVRLSVHVPDLLLLAAATAFALTALVVTWILVSRSGRRLEGDNELVERYRRFLALPWWMQVLLRLAPILPLIAIVSILVYAWPGLEESFRAFSRRILTPFSDAEAPVPAVPVVSLPWLGWLLGLLGLVAGLASLALAVVLLFAERIADWLERRNRPRRPSPCARWSRRASTISPTSPTRGRPSSGAIGASSASPRGPACRERPGRPRANSSSRRWPGSRCRAPRSSS